MSAAPGHDIVVIGASAGGVEALSELVRRLPADLSASLFIVMHMQAGVSSFLPDILSKAGRLRASHPVHGEAIVPGRIYIAPPDNHLMLRPGYMSVLRGPKENGHRPAVDALFRSAAIAYGPRVIGVVLTGYHDCGTAGLLSIKARGGLAVVQDPMDALVMNMPRTAIEHVQVDHVLPLCDIAGLVARLVATPPVAAPAHLPGVMAEIEGDEPGFSADIVCPICQGKLTETRSTASRCFADTSATRSRWRPSRRSRRRRWSARCGRPRGRWKKAPPSRAAWSRPAPRTCGGASPRNRSRSFSRPT